MSHKQAFKVRIRTRMLIVFIDCTSRELKKESKNSTAKGGQSVHFSTLLIKTMGLPITIFSLFWIFNHSDCIKTFLQSVFWKKSPDPERDAHRCFLSSMR